MARDATGKVIQPQGERIGDYFNVENAHKNVRRFELQAILSRYTQVQREMKWYRRWWRWLMAKWGAAIPVVPVELEQRGKEES